MVEAILWDNDGVLVDTECLFFESTRTILDTIGIQLSLRQFLDLSMREGRSAFELAIERGWGRRQVAELKTRTRFAVFGNVAQADAKSIFREKAQFQIGLY